MTNSSMTLTIFIMVHDRVGLAGLIFPVRFIQNAQNETQNTLLESQFYRQQLSVSNVTILLSPIQPENTKTFIRSRPESEASTSTANCQAGSESTKTGAEKNFQAREGICDTVDSIRRKGWLFIMESLLNL